MFEIHTYLGRFLGIAILVFWLLSENVDDIYLVRMTWEFLPDIRSLSGACVECLGVWLWLWFWVWGWNGSDKNDCVKDWEVLWGEVESIRIILEGRKGGRDMKLYFAFLGSRYLDYWEWFSEL